MNGTNKQLIRVAQYQDRNWLDVLDIVEMAVNNAPLVETDFSPYYLTYGYHPTFYHDLPEFTGADKSRRTVIDYRVLNKLTRKDKYPLPRIDEMLDKLSTGKNFTKMDLSSSFHQIRIRKGDEPKTAFQTRYWSFE